MCNVNSRSQLFELLNWIWLNNYIFDRWTGWIYINDCVVWWIEYDEKTEGWMVQMWTNIHSIDYILTVMVMSNRTQKSVDFVCSLPFTIFIVVALTMCLFLCMCVCVCVSCLFISIISDFWLFTKNKLHNFQSIISVLYSVYFHFNFMYTVNKAIRNTCFNFLGFFYSFSFSVVQFVHCSTFVV